MPLPDELSFEDGAAVSCGTGITVQGLRRPDMAGRDTLVAFGQGPVGLSGTLLGEAMGARVVAVDVTPERLELAERFGANLTLNPREVDVAATIKQLPYGEGADAAERWEHPGAQRRTRLRPHPGPGLLRRDRRGATRPQRRARHHLQATQRLRSLDRQLGRPGRLRPHLVDHKLPLGAIFTHRFTLDEAADAQRLFATRMIGQGVFLFE